MNGKSSINKKDYKFFALFLSSLFILNQVIWSIGYFLK